MTRMLDGPAQPVTGATWYMRGEQPRDRVLLALRGEPERWATPRELADALGLQIWAVSNALGSLYVRRLVERREIRSGLGRWEWRSI